MRIGTSGRRRLPAFYEGPLIIMAREGIQPNLLSLVIARPDLCDSLEAPIDACYFYHKSKEAILDRHCGTVDYCGTRVPCSRATIRSARHSGRIQLTLIPNGLKLDQADSLKSSTTEPRIMNGDLPTRTSPTRSATRWVAGGDRRGHPRLERK